jgi:hypothetical protein
VAAYGENLMAAVIRGGGRYDLPMPKAELIEQVKSMTDEEAAEAKLIDAPDWPSKATSIEEIRKRTGTTPMSPEDFDRHFGSLPTDGEG